MQHDPLAPKLGDDPLSHPDPLSHQDPLSSPKPGFGDLRESATSSGMHGVEHDLRLQHAPDETTAAAFHQEYQEKPQQKPSGDKDLLAKELEIISSKLDFLKASLENINQRLANIEKSELKKW